MVRHLHTQPHGPVASREPGRRQGELIKRQQEGESKSLGCPGLTCRRYFCLSRVYIFSCSVSGSCPDAYCSQYCPLGSCSLTRCQQEEGRVYHGGKEERERNGEGAVVGRMGTLQYLAVQPNVSWTPLYGRTNT